MTAPVQMFEICEKFVKSGDGFFCHWFGEVCVQSLCFLFYEGDVCYYDEKERFFIVDRIKELIKYKGFQVNCYFVFFSRYLLVTYILHLISVDVCEQT